MHEIEPYFQWRHLYIADEDPKSIFFGQTYSEFEFSQTVYNYYIHPQWDTFGSKNLYLKILFVAYESNFAIIELIGEWNDAIENDCMLLKRDLIDCLIQKGIYKFILITENVLNFHSSDDSYYEEWYQDIEEEGGWILFLNMPLATKSEFNQISIHRYAFFMEIEQWRTLQPLILMNFIEQKLLRIQQNNEE
jgi:hypothetical protein